jgi:uncharacterized membrane protein (UPF0127 family)
MTALSRCLLIVLLASTTTVSLAQSKAEPLSAFPQSLLAIRTAGGSVINFKIWSADTPSREEQGLMFVRQMDEHAGMLFLFPENRPVSMWMKNTYLPLDMLFMDRRGRIDYIAADAVPLSEEIIGPGTPEFAVLELNGGAAARLGIKPGDVVMHAAFKPQK